LYLSSTINSTEADEKSWFESMFKNKRPPAETPEVTTTVPTEGVTLT